MRRFVAKVAAVALLLCACATTPKPVVQGLGKDCGGDEDCEPYKLRCLANSCTKGCRDDTDCGESGRCIRTDYQSYGVKVCILR